MNENPKWYAIYTRPRWEKKILSYLLEQQIEYYCPLQKKRKKWSDRYKIVLEPVFKGYIFVRLGERRKWEVKKIPGVLNFVYWNGRPAKIRDEEIITIRKFLDEFDEVNLVSIEPAENDQVLVTKGVLMNYKGIVLEINGSNVKVLINSLGIALTALIKKSNLEVLGGAKPSYT